MESLIKGPEYRRKIDRDLTSLQEKFERCLNLKPIHSQLQDLEGKDLPQLKQQMKELDQQIVQLKSKQTAIEEELNDQIYLPLEQCEQIKTDIIMLDKYIAERKEIEKKITIYQQKLGKLRKATFVEEISPSRLGQGDKPSSRSLDQVKQAKDEAQNQFEALDKSLQRKHKDFRAQQDLVQGLRESLTELKNERLKLSSDIQKKERLDEQLQKLTTQIQTLKEEIEHDKQSLEPILVSHFPKQCFLCSFSSCGVVSRSKLNRKATKRAVYWPKKKRAWLDCKNRSVFDAGVYADHRFSLF